jgi:hypothetical protein
MHELVSCKLAISGAAGLVGRQENGYIALDLRFSYTIAY